MILVERINQMTDKEALEVINDVLNDHWLDLQTSGKEWSATYFDNALEMVAILPTSKFRKRI